MKANNNRKVIKLTPSKSNSNNIVKRENNVVNINTRNTDVMIDSLASLIKKK